jgi:hypothetical protein
MQIAGCDVVVVPRRLEPAKSDRVSIRIVDLTLEA